MRKTNEKLEIGVLYGLRALMVLFVMNYHIWQQSWIGQSVRVFGRTVGFDFWTRSSYLFVDGMILLSGFLLYLPHARAALEGTPVPSVRRFYFNRLVRILPSYLFSVLVMLFLVALPQHLYHTQADMTRDVLSHLTFTFLFSPATYVYTPLNVSLWTMAVEMQFYLLFPLLAAAMKKRPAVTAVVMMAAAWIYRAWVAKHFHQPDAGLPGCVRAGHAGRGSILPPAAVAFESTALGARCAAMPERSALCPWCGNADSHSANAVLRQPAGT